VSYFHIVVYLLLLLKVAYLNVAIAPRGGKNQQAYCLDTAPTRWIVTYERSIGERRPFTWISSCTCQGLNISSNTSLPSYFHCRKHCCYLGWRPSIFVGIGRKEPCSQMVAQAEMLSCYFFPQI